MSNRKKVAVAILAVIALICFASTWALLTSEHKRRTFDSVNYPYKLSVVDKNNYVNFQCSDVNSDGRTELFCLLDSRFDNYGPPTSMNYYSHNFRIIDEYRFDGEIAPFFFDLDNDGEKEIVVSKRRNDSVFVEIRTLSQKTLTDFFALTKDEHTRKGRWDCHIEIVDFVDLNGDSRKDIVGKVLTNRTGSPRGLYAFDYRKGQIIWKYKTGALVHSVSVHDINQDGKNEYLLTTHCAWNLKKPINATDDGYVYFIIVDHQGNAKLIERLGGVRGARSRLFTGDIDGDQQTDYIVVYNNRERITGDDPTVIYLYQSSSNTLVRKLSLHRSFWYLELQDITGDGQADLVFVDGDGNIGRISYINSIKNFKLIEDKQLPFQFIPGTVNEFIADLNNDARNEILINAGDNLFVLDSRFNTQAIYPKLRFLSFVQSGFGKIRILAGQENMTFLLDYEKNPQYYLRKAIPNLQILSISLFAFSLLGILAIVIKNEWTKPYQEISEKGMIRVDRKNRIGFINETARDMLHLLPDSPLPQSLFEIVDEEKFPELHRILLETDRSHSQFTEHVELSVNDNRRIFQVEVEPITGIAGRIKGRWIKLTDQTLEIQAKTIMDWARVARALAHEIKNFLMPIWLDLSSIQQMYGQDVPENRDKYDLFTSAIGLQIERIRKASNAFMNFTELSHSNIRLCNINEIIEDAIEKLEIKQYYPDVVTWKLLDNPPRVRVDAERIGSALSNLINNALNAVSEKGEVTITTSLIEKIAQEEKGINTFVQIEIADTGVGMSKEEVQKVFKAGFSTKESGTGFGMTIAKYAIESHGGTIQIVSKKGSGTVVTVELPVS